MGKIQLSDFYNAKHFCFDESTRACLRICGFHSSFCYTDDLSIGPLIPYDSSDRMNYFLAYAFIGDSAYKYNRAYIRNHIQNNADFLNAITKKNDSMVIWFSNASWEYIGALFALSLIDDDNDICLINCSEHIHPHTGKPFITSAQAGFISDEPECDNDFIKLIKECDKSDQKIARMEQEWISVRQEPEKVRLIKNGQLLLRDEESMIEIIKTYVQEEADYDIDTLLYKVQSKMISNEKISVSPKFIFTFILKHYQHFIGRNDIFKCRQPKL